MGSGPALLSELTHEGALPLSLRFLERQSPPRFAEAPSAAEGEAEGAGIFILNDPFDNLSSFGCSGQAKN